MSLEGFLLGTITFAIGLALVMKTEAVLGFAGRIYWAETWLGTFGGTRLAIKLIGIITIFFGVMLAFGLLGPLLLSILAPLPIF